MSGEPAHEGFAAHGVPSGDEWHVTVRGELDRSTRGLLVLACLDGGSRPVVVDLAAVTFMDAAGFGGLVTARAVIATRGATLAVRNATGAADRLLELLEATEPAIGGYWPPRLDLGVAPGDAFAGRTSSPPMEPPFELPFEPPSEPPIEWME